MAQRLVGLVGQGVGLATEYRQHRKSQKLSRENSQQSETAGDTGDTLAGPSQTHRHRSSPSPTPNAAPPSYDQVTSSRSLAQGPSYGDDKKAADYGYDEELSGEDSDFSSNDTLSIEDDEEDWDLDEAIPRSDSPPTYEQSEADVQPTDALVRDVLLHQHAHSSMSITTTPKLRTPLPCPVIIPQRRPGTKSRGFIRAYAPVLEGVGIDQATFLSFLENFHKSSQASPIFGVIQVSAAIAGFAPSVIAMAVTTTVQIAAQTGARVQERTRTNNFLDKINEELFKPAGCFAFLMKYVPDNTAGGSGQSRGIGGKASELASRFGIQSQTVDLSTNQILAKYTSQDGSSSGSGSGFSAKFQNLRVASGTSTGHASLPQAAPLIFPDLDDAAQRSGGEAETLKDKAKDAKRFLEGYFDRRAQAQYATNDPMSSLVVPEEHRRHGSQYSDPNHPMYNNGLVGLVSGGKIAKPNLRGQLRGQRDQIGDLREQALGSRGMVGGSGGRRDRRNVRRGYGDEDLYGDISYGRSGLGSGRYGYAEDDAYSSRMGRRRLGDRSYGRQSRGYGYDNQYDEDDQYSSPMGLGGRRARRRQGGGLVGGLIGLAAGAINERSGGASSSQSPAPSAAGRSVSPRDVEYDQQYGGGRVDDRPQRGLQGRSDGRGRKQQSNGGLNVVKRVMREDVLYLMIVNMPSEAELAEARQTLAAMKSS